MNKSKTSSLNSAVGVTEHLNQYFNPFTGPLVYAEDADVSVPGSIKFKIRPTVCKGLRGYHTLRKALTRRAGMPDTSGGGADGSTHVGWYITGARDFEVTWTGKDIYVTWTDNLVVADLPKISDPITEEPKDVKPPYGADIVAATEYINETCPSLQGPLVSAEDATIIGPGRIRFKIQSGTAKGLRGYSSLRRRIAKVCGDPDANDGDSDGNESAGWERDNDRELWVEWENKEISVLLIDRLVAEAVKPKRTKKVEESPDLKVVRSLYASVRLTLDATKKLAASLNEREQKVAHDLLNEITDDTLKGTS
jgi:hypothetical protein